MCKLEQKNVEIVTAFIEDERNQNDLEKTDQFFAKQIREAFVNRKFTVEETIAQGEKVIAKILITGKHQNMFAGHKPTNKSVTITQFREFHVVENEIVKHNGWFDTATLLPQIKTDRCP